MEKKSEDDLLALVAHVDIVAAQYKGDSAVLFSAVGALFVGRLYGWKVLRVFLSSATYAKYQKILGIQFRDVMLPETELSERAFAYRIYKRVAATVKDFWHAIKIPSETLGISSKEKRILR